MTTPKAVTVESLKNAFELAEEWLRGSQNRSITETITDEARQVPYETLLNDLFQSALSDTFPTLEVSSKLNRIDLSIVENGSILLAGECKGMVSNSRPRDQMRDSLDVHGIRTKLHYDKRSQNSVESDLMEIKSKIPQHMLNDHYQIFVPIIYELYRTGAEDEWMKKKKPWVTQPTFRNHRGRLKEDLKRWFQSNSNCKHLHSTDSIELYDADALWKKQSKSRYPRFRSLEAYVSFHVFYRKIRSGG